MKFVATLGLTFQFKKGLMGPLISMNAFKFHTHFYPFLDRKS